MPSRRPPSRTPRLLLRHFTPQDAEAWLVLSEEDAYRTWLPSQTYESLEHARSVLEFLVRQYDDPGDPRLGPYVLAIEHSADRALIGHVGLSPFTGDVEIGFSIARAYQRKGLATEAVVAACRWAFDELDLGRILGIASSANTASKYTLARAGFRFDGSRRMTFQGTDQDVDVYVLSRAEELDEGM